MKIVITKSSFLFAFLAFFLISCEDPSSDKGGDDSGNSDYQKTWTISGTIDFSGCDSSTGEADVKFAAFYDANAVSASASSTLVSNIKILGNDYNSSGTMPAAPVSSITFTLDIDVSTVTPDFDDRIILTVWQDTDNDNIPDDTWIWTAKGNTGCDYFEDNSFCSIWFNNSSLYGSIGWKIEDDSDDVAITSSSLSFSGVTMNDGGYLW